VAAGNVRVDDQVTYRPGAYQPALDGLRGLSILAVMLYHNDYSLVGGYLGVDVFFVLSGFLITSLLFDEWRRRGRIALKRFYARRALRLFPALATLLAIGTAFALAFPRAPQSPHVLRGVEYSLLYVSNWFNARDAFLLGPLAQTWSLSVEEQFYLVWPLMFIGLLRLTKGRHPAWIVALIAAAFAAWRALFLAHGASTWRIYNGTDTRADSLLIGAATALAMARPATTALLRRSRVTPLAAGAGILLIGWLMLHFPLQWPGYGYGVFSLVALAAAAIVAQVLSRPTSVLARVLSVRWLVWIGRLSYSLYLWHLPIFGFVKADRLGLSERTAWLIRWPLSFLAAMCSFYYIERRFLRLRDRFRGADDDERAQTAAGAIAAAN
jgi:peptidoglycan/LPS O-acetylase OafA/YrhL